MARTCCCSCCPEMAGLVTAQAAAAGKSNCEIAGELFISVKTVEFHLGQILARLNLDSRTQIARALAARQVLPGSDRKTTARSDLMISTERTVVLVIRPWVNAGCV